MPFYITALLKKKGGERTWGITLYSGYRETNTS